jgi:penicillin-binding protein 2
VGYRSIADRRDIEHDDCLTNLGLGDKTGKKGAESAFDCDLRGKRGKKLIELDAHGREMKTLGLVPPEAGKDIHLALDMNLQKRAFDMIEATASARAAVIVTKPKTGELMVMAANPSYDPQAFENGDQAKMKAYLTAPEHPLFNRATEGTYPPGSIFKLIVATGALEDKKVDENTLIHDTGQVKVGPAIYNNWFYTDYGKTDGDVNMVRGLQRSNDIYFYKVGEKLGEGRIKHWSEEFGLGQKVPFPFEQADGLIPSPFWKKERLGEDWFTGDTYNFSIGQGYALATPLQMHQVGAVFANRGTVCDPQLLKNAYPLCHHMKISKSTVDLVRKGMRAACETGGTAWPLFDFAVDGKRIPMGCKTGTAESQDPSTHPHAWFTVFAPFDNPQIQVTVMVENGGQGSSVAAPIAKEILTAYFSQNK